MPQPDQRPQADEAAATDAPAQAPSADPHADTPLDGPADAQPDPALVSEFAEFSDNLEHFFEDPSWSGAVGTFAPVLLELGRIILIIFLLLVAVSFVARWAQRAAARALARTSIDPTLGHFLSRLVKYIAWILAIPIALSVLGIQATSLAAVIGAAGLAIGLGLQGALANISAGILLLALRPVRIGDYVDIQGEMGEVKELGLFYTVITTFQNEVVSIPKQQILSDKVQNLTGNPTRRVDVPIGVAYGTDLRLAQRSLLEAATSIQSRAKDRDPAVWLTGFGASSIDFEVHVYCPARNFLTVRHEAIHAINDALAREKIEIPFPQRTLSGSVRLVPPKED